MHNQLCHHWKKEIARAWRNYRRIHIIPKHELRRYVRHAIYQYWQAGGLGGNPANAIKYFPKKDNSWVL